MKALSFNKRSWHTWLVRYFTPWYAADSKDFCQYTRRVLVGALLFLISVFLAAGVLLFIAQGIAWDIGWMFNLIKFVHLDKTHPEPVWQGLALGFNVIASIASVLAGLIFSIEKIKSGMNQRRCARIAAEMNNPPPFTPQIVKPPGFMRMSYRRIKDKTCFMVEFK